jgi:hypothetical protein
MLRKAEYETLQTTMQVKRGLQQKLVVILKKAPPLVGFLPTNSGIATNLVITVGAVKPPEAVVTSVAGNVQFRRAGSQVWQTAVPQQALFAGDEVRTGEQSEVTIRWPDSTRCRIRELTTLFLGEFREIRTRHVRAMIKG